MGSRLAGSRWAHVLCVWLGLAFAAPTVAQYWSWQFAPMGLVGPSGYDGEGYCLTEWQGNAVVGGWFESAGGQPSSHVAIWNGRYWEPMGAGINTIPNFVLGLQQAVVVGGPFWEVDCEEIVRCASWDGAWHALPGLPDEPLCAAYHDGHIYVGGNLPTGDVNVPFTPFMRWEGLQWVRPAGTPGWDLEDEVHALTSYGGRLHFGGDFSFDPPGPIAETWGHTAWSEDEGTAAFGAGLTLGWVECFEPGVGNLFVGGSFQYADGQESRGLVLHAGDSYDPCGDPSADRYVMSMGTLGETLYTVCREYDGATHWRVRAYENATWQPPQGGDFTDGINAIANIGGELYVSGFFANGIVRWDDGEWVHLGGGIGMTTFNRHWIHALVTYDGDVIAGGENIRLPSVIEGQGKCTNVVRWDGDAWHRVGGGVGNDVRALAVYDGDLYAGTDQSFGVDRIQRWDGVGWSGAGAPGNSVWALVVHEGELIAGGAFTSFDGVPANRVAAYDGNAWHALGGGLDGTVRALYSDNGVLYAGGSFTTADGAPAARIELCQEEC